ncbi:MAG: type II toxin-antitoxin system Phd/YefM family antitoxin [Clostridia bacterium]|nr:type II toxin-antitoxin system Phd/YefM family antitoxin [Clostridia bacterium]
MTDMTSAITNMIPISMFNRGLAGQVFEDVKKSGAKVVVKNNAAECVLLSPEEYVKLMEEVNDARLLTLASERMANFDASKTVSEEDVLNEFGINADDVSDIQKVEIE